MVDGSNTASPVGDGTTYATFEYDFRNDITVVSVKRVGVTQPLSRVQLTGYARDLQISPSQPNLVLARWGSSATSTDDEWTVLDLDSRAILNRYPGGNTAAGWLPNGRFLYLSADQTLSSGSVGATGLTALGQLAIQGVVPRSLRVNSEGTQVLYRLVALGSTGNLLRSDLWVSQIDVSNVRQLTETGVATFGMWSPNGQHVAFMNDTGAVCTGPDCAGVGTCVTKLAPSGATRLTLGASAVTDIRLRDAAGVERVLGCSLLGWTP